MQKLRHIALFALSAGAGCGGATPQRPLAVPPAQGTLAGEGLHHQCMEKARDAWARRVPSSIQNGSRNLLAIPREQKDAVDLTPLDDRTLERVREDISTTLRIRRALLAESKLSVAAKSLKILTKDGKVTLRGALDDPEERQSVVAIARTIVGPDNVQARF